MPMSLTTATELVLGTLGRQPPPEWPPASIVAVAWQAFLDHRSWRWAAGTRASIALVVGQARYRLPDDVGQIIKVSGPSHWTHPVNLTTWAQLEALRARGYNALMGQPPFHGALRWTRAETGEYHPELELYPVPAGTAQGPLEVSYLPAGTAPLRAGDDFSLAFPPHILPVWVEWLRAYTLGLVEHDMGTVDQRLAPITQGTLMTAAIHRDVGWHRIKTPGGGAATEYREWPNLVTRRPHR